MIRAYTHDDHEKIRYLYRDMSYLEPTLSCYQDPHYTPYVYEQDEGILGVILLERAYLNLSIFNLHVDREHRSKGIGQTLLNFALDYARERGLHGVRVSTSEHNTDAQQFYTRQGFEKVGSVKHYDLKGQEAVFFYKEA